MSKQLKPLADNVLVRRFKQESITAGGIHVPETSQNKTQSGVIVSCGAGKVLKDGSTISLSVKEGDVVVFGKYSGTEVDVNGEEFLMLKESDLLGVFQSE